jgi:hypothetical protein
MKKIFYTIAIIILGSIFSFGQNEIDALRYSQMYYGGTARFASMAGAFGALGADPSTSSTNPAGLGLYNKSEFTFTPNLVFNNTNSDFMNNGYNDYKSNFNINNLAYVGSASTGGTTGLVAANWGITYNRLNSFHYNSYMQGKNNSSSYTDVFAENSNGYTIEDLNPYRERLAWETYSIDSKDSINLLYESALPNYGELQSRKFEKRGYMGEMDFAFGINYSNTFYWGFTLGWVWTRYWEDSYHTEVDEDQTIDNFNYLYYDEHLKTYGSGINMKTGFIYKPANFVRISGAYHSPTWLTLEDNYWTEMSASFDDVGSYEVISPSLLQRYNLRTPSRFLGGLAFIFGKYGAISIDYEYVDYSWARYSTYNGFYSYDANSEIVDSYKGAHNVKIGGELRAGKISFRGGFGYYDSPYRSSTSNANSFTYQYTGGLGFNFGGYYIDLAYVHQTNSVNYYLYDPSIAYIDRSLITSNSNKFMVTFGARF